VIEDVTLTSLIASIAVGLVACALLVINNLRDIPGDTVAGKKTLAVRLGDGRTRVLFYAEIILAATAIVVTAFTQSPWVLLGLLGIVAMLPAAKAVREGALGRDLIPVLGIVGRAQMVLGVTYALGIALGAS
jgi:1,4-dihydroxy-2-naphthoate octaprenyltransferase